MNENELIDKLSRELTDAMYNAIERFWISVKDSERIHFFVVNLCSISAIIATMANSNFNDNAPEEEYIQYIDSLAKTAKKIFLSCKKINKFNKDMQ